MSTLTRLPRLAAAVECAVCLNIYDAEKRKPKNLNICGHSFCVTCLQSIEKNMCIKCPTCRQKTRLRNVGVDGLATDFTALAVLDSLCPDCLNGQWSVRCKRCFRNLCQICHRNHCTPEREAAGIQIRLLEDIMEELKGTCNDDTIKTNIVRGRKRASEATHLYGKVIKQLEKNTKVLQGNTFRSSNNLLNKVQELRICVEEQRQMKLSAIKERMSDYIQKVLLWTTLKESSLVSADNTLKELRQEVIDCYSTISAAGFRHLIEQCERKSKELSYIKDSHLAFAIEDVDVNVSEDLKVRIKQTDEKVLVQSNTNVAFTVPSVTLWHYFRLYMSKLVLAIFGQPPLSIDTIRPIAVEVCRLTGNIIVVDDSRVRLFDKNFWELKLIKTNKKREFGHPYDAAFDATGNIFISDRDHNNIRTFTSGGYQIASFGTKGKGSLQFSAPKGLTFNTKGHLFVCDSNNRRIQVFTTRGTYIRTIGGPDIFPGGPAYCAVSDTGKLLVSDEKGNLHLFETSGTHLRTILSNTPPHNMKATGIAADRNQNHTFIVSNQDGKIVILKEDCRYICCFSFCTIWQRVRERNVELRGLAVNGEQDIFVCDRRNSRLTQIPYNVWGLLFLLCMLAMALYDRIVFFWSEII